MQDNLNQKDYVQKIAVIKVGGSILANQAHLDQLARQVSTLKVYGVKCLIVHGGGPQIDALLKENEIVCASVKGIRLTDAKTMSYVSTAIGNVKEELTHTLTKHDIKLEDSTDSFSFFSAKKMQPISNGEFKIDPGWHGEIESVNLGSLNLAKTTAAIVSPIGIDKSGNYLNLNADHAAMALAAHLKSEQLVFLSDVEGVLQDPQEVNSLIKSLSANQAQTLLESDCIQGGMIQKLANSLEAIRRGVEKIYIADGRQKDVLESLLVYKKSVGTVISA